MASLSHHLLHHRLLLDSSNSPEINGPNRSPRGPYSSEATLDTNMVIILAALVCALIFALGLNSIVRCAMRCSRRLSWESSNQITSVRTGLKKSSLQRIPVSVYHADLDIPSSDCPICLGEFSTGERVRVLPKCHHGFHVTCIDTWLVSHSSCPTCRQSLLDQQLISSDAGVGGVADTAIIVEEVS